MLFLLDLEKEEMEYLRGRGTLGSAWFRRRCCCWKMAEPTQSSGCGEVELLAGPYEGFGLRESCLRLRESCLGSLVNLCATLQ